MFKQIIIKVLRSMAVAMGVAVIVLNIMGTLSTDTAIKLLGIGLTALAISSFQF